MKKSIVISFAFLTSGFAFSQDYQCIRDGAEYYYTDSNLFHAIRIDSVVPEGESLVYYNYSTMIWDDSSGCYSRFGPSWIGKKVTVKPDGKNIFYNKIDSTIRIETLKNPGESWTCYYFSNGNYIQASIAEIQEMEFLTLTDSVKTITFQTYSSNGTPITHAISDKYLLLSKNYGLSRTINFKLFPDLSDDLFYDEACSEFTLYGISDPPVGKQNLNAAQVYNFDVGDEIDTHRDFEYTGGYSEEDKLKYYILEKTYFPNIETVVYTMRKCGWTKTVIPFQGTYYDYYKDTICEAFFIGEDSVINTLPDEVIINYWDPDYWEYSTVISTFYGTTGRQVKTVWGGFLSFYPHDCIIVYDSKNNKDFGNDQKYYIDGLGYYFYFQDQLFSIEHTNPVYYSKGIDEWGSPWAFSCESLPVNTEEFEVSEKEFTIYPNPMHTSATLTIAGKQDGEYHLQLYNSMGNLVRDYRFQTNELVIERQDLTDGIYFFTISNGTQIFSSGKLIIH